VSKVNPENILHNEVEEVNKEVTELRQRLHEAQEGQARCEDKIVSLSTYAVFGEKSRLGGACFEIK